MVNKVIYLTGMINRLKKYVYLIFWLVTGNLAYGQYTGGPGGGYASATAIGSRVSLAGSILANNALQLYPNPSAPGAIVQLTGNRHYQNINLELHSAEGTFICRCPAQGNDFQLPPHLRTGMYMATLKSDNKRLKVFKLSVVAP